MDIKPQTTQPISDDQDLAKILAGVDENAKSAATTTASAGQTPAMPSMSEMPPMPEETQPQEVQPDEVQPEAPEVQAQPAPLQDADDGELSDVKNDAIQELRPLVDKLNISPEEKFDTYLLLIRSTDDKTLIAPAHEAAKNIPDESRRAEALLDIIKEIDFLSNPQQQ